MSKPQQNKIIIPKMNFKNIFKNRSSREEIREKQRWWGVLNDFGVGDYSDAILQMALAPILDELKKVAFYADEKYHKEANFVAQWINDNSAMIFKYYFNKGFCAVSFNAKTKVIDFDVNAYIKKSNDYSIELSNPLSDFSTEFEFFQKSKRALIIDILEAINNGLTAQDAVIKILGQFTIFSRELEDVNKISSKLTNDEKEEFEKTFNMLFSGNNIGSAVYFTNANLKRDTITFPLDRLKIRETIEFLILILAGTLNVPYDLIPLTGKSTYANQEEAIAYLRTHTISGIAEDMLQLGRKILKATGYLVPKSALDYKVIIDTNTHGEV